MLYKIVGQTCVALALVGCGPAAVEVEEMQPGPILANAEGAPPLGPYSSLAIAGQLVFTSGNIPFDGERGEIVAGDIELQTHQTLDNLESSLAVAGLGLDDVLKVTIFLKNPGDIPGLNEVYSERMGDHRPARTLVPGTDWGDSGILVEIEAIAQCPQSDCIRKQ